MNNILLSLYKTLRIYLENQRINRQKEDMAFLFDAIINHKPKATICRHLHQKLPVEALNILSTTYDYRKKFSKLKLKKLKGRVTISVVIPHYNQSQYLNQNLLYLTKQSILADEIIVVDDQSKDYQQVEKICRKYQKFLNIRLFKPPVKLYAGGSKQYGAEKASGDIVMMHDADDLSHPDRIKLTKYFFEIYPNALHLNVGFVRFPKNNFVNFIKDFSQIDINKYIVKTDKITASMRKMFIEQQFSGFTVFGSRIGCYGYNDGYGFGTQAGHVAYRQELTGIFKWLSPDDYIFTKFEDYSFNYLLFLSCQQSYQIDLPLIYYRIGTSTNLVNY